MVTDSRQKRFVMNMELRQCFAKAKLFRLKQSQVLAVLMTPTFVGRLEVAAADLRAFVSS